MRERSQETFQGYPRRRLPHEAAWAERSGVDLLQGFADVRLPLGPGGHVTLRGGRQVMIYGTQRLISTGPNIRSSFDGGLGRWEAGDWLVDAFLVNGSRKLWSVYATRPSGLRRLSAVYSVVFPSKCSFKRPLSADPPASTPERRPGAP